jgi:hypothetical protein
MKTSGSVLLLLTATALSAFSQAASSSSPERIVTNDGRVYDQAVIERAEPDGLVIRYQPVDSGVGMAKLKFRNLPESTQTRYGYEAKTASAFEADRDQATTQWRVQALATDSIRQYRNLAELHRSLAGDAFVSYSLALDASGKVQVQGMTANFSPYAPCVLPTPAVPTSLPSTLEGANATK